MAKNNWQSKKGYLFVSAGKAAVIAMPFAAPLKPCP
jgi:hypothetical protein